MIDEIQKRLLKEVADLDSLPIGAYNIRANGAPAGRNTTAHINIVTKTDKPGIDIIIAPGTRNESVHIPVVVSQTGLKDLVYNDFYIGENADVVIIAGCGIHTARVLRRPPMTASIPSMWGKAPTYAMWKSTTAKAKAAASG